MPDIELLPTFDHQYSREPEYDIVDEHTPLEIWDTIIGDAWKDIHLVAEPIAETVTGTETLTEPVTICQCSPVAEPSRGYPYIGSRYPPIDIPFGSSMLSPYILTNTKIMEKWRAFRAENGIEPDHIVANSRTMERILRLYFEAYLISYTGYPELSKIKPYGMTPVIMPRYKDNKFSLC